MLCLVDLVLFALLAKICFDCTLLQPFFGPEPLGFPKCKSSSISTRWRSFCNNCRNKVKLLVFKPSLQAFDHKHRTYYKAFFFFTFHQPCFCKSWSNWIRWMLLWNLILVVVVKRFSYFLLIKMLLSKKDITSATSLEIKLGKPDDEISSNVFTATRATVPLI